MGKDACEPWRGVATGSNRNKSYLVIDFQYASHRTEQPSAKRPAPVSKLSYLKKKEEKQTSLEKAA